MTHATPIDTHKEPPVSSVHDEAEASTYKDEAPTRNADQNGVAHALELTQALERCEVRSKDRVFRICKGKANRERLDSIDTYHCVLNLGLLFSFSNLSVSIIGHVLQKSDKPLLVSIAILLIRRQLFPSSRWTKKLVAVRCRQLNILLKMHLLFSTFFVVF